jgi:hypothetical protein
MSEELTPRTDGMISPIKLMRATAIFCASKKLKEIYLTTLISGNSVPVD